MKILSAALNQPTTAQANRPELFFGLVGAAGTDLNKTQDGLEQALRSVGYLPKSIRLSELLWEYSKQNNSALHNEEIASEDDRILRLMELGDKIRKDFNRGDAVAALAITAVRSTREELSGCATTPVGNHAFIFNSLKHPSEVDTLRLLYGESLFIISAYSPTVKRFQNLKKRIAKSYTSMQEEKFADKANKIISIDQKRPGTNLGQDVRGTFPLADAFVDADNSNLQVKRFIDLLFGSPFITPTIDEHGMFHARAAALRSADLSRQVGALITSKDGEFIAAGCNEVPAPGGGAYWEGRPERDDDRDFQHGRDANAVMKYEIVAEVFQLLQDNNWISSDLANLSPTELTERALDGKGKFSFKDARIASLIEFGRIVHAEMSAITESARRGISVKGAVLYCTTFPCHMCARHIIATGIDRVVYIEPYPKSMTKDLYKSSVRVEKDGDSAKNAVEFEPFVGIAPAIYMKLFAMPKRKDRKGYVVNWDSTRSLPRFVGIVPRYIALEAGFIEILAPFSHIRNIPKGSATDDRPNVDKNPD